MRLLNKTPLKLRLTLLYVGLFSALFAALWLGLYTETQHTLLAETTANLRAQTRAALQNWETSPPRPLAALTQSLAERGLAAAVVDASGAVLASAGTPSNFAQAVTTACAAPPLTSPCTLTVGNERYIVVAQPLKTAGMAVLLTGRSLQSLDRVLARQRLGLVVGLAILITLGTALGLWLAGSMLKPLDEMTTTCNRIAAGDLSHRVNLPHRSDEIGRLAEAIDRMAARVEATLASQQRFIASAAHELRTPLAALQGSLDVLLRGALDEPPTARRLTQSMYREVTRLFRLCDQLLGLSRAHAAEAIHTQPVEIHTFLREFATQASFLAQERELTLQEGEPLTIEADPDALKRMLFNLVDNAVQHTFEGGKITIGWEQAGNGVKIFVADNGEGIAPQDLPHIFEPFYRGDRSRSRRRGGTGLGLAMVKALVEAHGGKITAASTPGQGARFTIWLPKG